MREMVLTSSCLIAVIALLRRVLRGRISPRVVYALWLLAAARLLIPGTLFPAPVSVVGAAAELRATLRPGVEAAGQTEVLLPVDPGEHPALPLGGGAAPEPETPAPPQAPAALTRPVQWPEAVWAAGVCPTVGVLALSNLTFAHRLRRRRTRLELDTAAWSGRLPVYLVEELDSPCLFGLLRPAVYLNRAALDGDCLPHILTHEYIHFRHGDHLWALLRGVCTALHWFNPLVWWGAVLCRRDCELACDEAAIRRLGEAERIAYGQTLLRMVSRRPVSPLHTATTMTAGRRTMAERIALIARRPRTLGLALAAVGMVMCGAVVLTFGGMAQAAPEPPPGEAGPADTAPDRPEAGSTHTAPVPPEAGAVPDGADRGGAGPQALSAAGYTHPSGLFSLTLPGSWLGRVVCVESEDGVSFYDAGSYEAGTEAGWLMAVVLQPVSWADQYHRNDYILDPVPSGGSPYVYVLNIDQEPDEASLELAPPEVRDALAESFRLLADGDAFSRLIHDSYRDNMPLAVAYLPYLSWSGYRDAYGEEAMADLLDGLYRFVRDSDVSWGQIHDILSNRSRSDPAIDGAYATAIQEGILWSLYEKNPQRFASVVGSVYLTNEERSDVAEWLRYPLSERAGRADAAENLLTDEEIYEALGLTPLPGSVAANYSDVTLSAAGDTFSLQPVNVSGVYAVSYTSDNQEVAVVESLEGTVTAVGPGMTTVWMHVECAAGQYDFACTVRCAWDEGGRSSAAGAELLNSWQAELADLMYAIPPAPDRELVYDSLEEDGLETAIRSCLEDYAREYLNAYGRPEYSDRLSQIVLESEIPQSPAYGTQLTVRYRIEGLRDREWSGEPFTLFPQMGGPLETTFTVMDLLRFQNAIRFDAMGQPL